MYRQASAVELHAVFDSEKRLGEQYGCSRTDQESVGKGVQGQFVDFGHRRLREIIFPAGLARRATKVLPISGLVNGLFQVTEDVETTH